MVMRDCENACGSIFVKKKEVKCFKFDSITVNKTDFVYFSHIFPAIP